MTGVYVSVGYPLSDNWHHACSCDTPGILVWWCHQLRITLPSGGCSGHVHERYYVQTIVQLVLLPFWIRLCVHYSSKIMPIRIQPCDSTCSVGISSSLGGHVHQTSDPAYVEQDSCFPWSTACDDPGCYFFRSREHGGHPTTEYSSSVQLYAC